MIALSFIIAVWHKVHHAILDILYSISLMVHNSQLALSRRGFGLGSVNAAQTQNQSIDLARWHKGQPVFMQGICNDLLAQHNDDVQAAERLYKAILDEHECDELLAQPQYAERLQKKFESLGCSVNTGDDQEIDTVLFDAIDNEKVLAEDLWLKISWLSFYEEDASMRFRFSFGVDHEEDVAADHVRQQYAAELTDAIFPESRVITDNQNLITQLTTLLGSDSVRFVERIIYFNSPSGGAYLHHDRERGHAGVVYAQLSGATFWLALPRSELVAEISNFVKTCSANDNWPSSIDATMQQELIALSSKPDRITEELNSFANSTLIHLINETEAFVQRLIEHGHGQLLQAGDALLLPQESDEQCCWHSVFNLGDESGQALSFAIRRG